MVEVVVVVCGCNGDGGEWWHMVVVVLVVCGVG